MIKLNRRDFIKTGTVSAFSIGSVHNSLASESHQELKYPKGKADACIYIWLGGGACQIDTFDPKKKTSDGKKKPGSFYDSIDTAIPGVRVCEHLKKTAQLLDRCAVIRTLYHNINSEHGAATNLVHTGRMPSGTIMYPSIGSIVTHQLGPKSDDIPPYVVMGYPNIAREPGFLGSKYGYIYLTQIDTGPVGLVSPPDVDFARQKRRQSLLNTLRTSYQNGLSQDQLVADQIEASESGFRIAGGPFQSVFNLENESSTLREEYGSEFGQRCLLARRLIQNGVRFVEVSFNLNFLNGTGWDTHKKGQLKQHLLIQDLDQSLSTLIKDLEKNRILDNTLVVIATEFGRPPEFDAEGGRGHQCGAFSGFLAGGGLQTGQAIGQTDELGKTIVERPVSIPDYHATIHAALGIDPSKNLFAGSRPVPITDHGKPVMELFS